MDQQTNWNLYYTVDLNKLLKNNLIFPSPEMLSTMKQKAEARFTVYVCDRSYETERDQKGSDSILEIRERTQRPTRYGWTK